MGGSCDLNVVCGNGVVQGSEECECPSGQTKCRHCTNCKLAPGKECTPDTDAVCCSAQGIAATTSVKCTMPDKKRGYCNKGVCSTFKCNHNVYGMIRDTFCRVYPH